MNEINIRRFKNGDEEAIYKLLSDEIVNTYLPMFCLKDMQEAKMYLEHILNDQMAEWYAIASDDEVIGYIHVSLDESHDFGYALRKEYWHQGIVTKAAQEVIAQLKATGFGYITATHDVKNVRSGNVMKKLGMHYCYSYEELWQPKNYKVIFRMYQLNFDENNSFVFKKYWEKYSNHFVGYYSQSIG